MESTDNYWITLYDMLKDAGMDVYLVNARYVKGVPGRKKTDVRSGCSSCMPPVCPESFVVRRRRSWGCAF
jgi:transposase